MTAVPSVTATPEIVIVGAGFGGIGMAIQLKKAGIDSFVVLEKDGDLGGTWRANAYPGCACDVPSHLYSYSFALNPDWSRMFSPREEIWDYLRSCVRKYGIEPHLRYGVRVASMRWEESAGRWRVETAGGEVLTPRVVVSAIGALHVPSYPGVPGRDRFTGRQFHSAEWDSGYDLTGKRVAVVGTGASAVQFVPRIAEQVSRLHVFQRTPAWIHPRPDAEIPAERRRRFRSNPLAMRAFRASIYLALELRGLGFAVSPKLMGPLEDLARRHLRRQVGDPELRSRLTPDYTIGCKRILLSSDYYPALARPNVELVTDPIAEITEHGIRTRDGTSYDVDAIVYGTGFRVTSALLDQQIVGRDGLTLQDAWADGVTAHHGITVAGFPNLFMLLGPNTGLAHTSVVFMIETQVRHVMSCLRMLRRRRGEVVEVEAAAQRRFDAMLRRRLDRAVWSTGGCTSWYLDEHGVNRTLWPGFTFEYWARTRRARRSDYRIAGA
ncbi:Predicted flavoprotein CzcO associated with the cation diffusion facilitator CzcD [Actinopolymorpha cephalotaxi]|uniref:Cation diffusion facilitator CzcD-associated flavoprotein CzcO n=1 Tax=Actinopolymorpha cephalotaxi TaxID=504797 RepID=A0A1I2PBU8_9ACTN|nr:NAD(P)/FAD-dependent oxidoreductase [Actinopolymorpha cephalotaxi]NYH83742.1 cation diffusion facilitator CzcD-associated flavoprotein CzcO [Actinopolymorpha cephalotaxi]SFG11437.1 Predicted flavoprotein CzcO associated with the cation diffusion facilitator CzcD [Actinopolymorpha cephalotaxi]